ncbi:RNA polymerase sigma factor [Flavobacterium inviolabile]|uniref:RNA polymerase sigma factor n=1 Tax=Flavobacterium inviolabile TaxID=2748320 RepID=UPI0015A866BE|nr:RNA polymerase sigma factor [Flavobacterium inviolabile]
MLSLETKPNDIDNLIIRCQNGSRGAQFEIYNRFYKAMYNTAYRIVKDEHWAEDIMQESFLSAFLNMDAYKKEVSFGAWLKKIVVNKSIDNYKKRHKMATEALHPVLNKVEDIPDDNTQMDYSNLKAQQVMKTIQSLQDNYRIALTLFLIEGYDQEEISQIMGITEMNCRTMISRAKDKLRIKLNEAVR